MSNPQRALMLGAALVMGIAAPLRAEFVPGNLYISAVPLEAAGPADRVYEFDPATGASREIAVLPDALRSGMSGLVFTPDYSSLRASVASSHVILEFDGNANVNVALDINDGIFLPVGSNNVAYDRAGNFYVVNQGARNIMRFPADGGPGAEFADVDGGGPIATAPDNSVYCALKGDEEIQLYTAPGEGGRFDRLPEGDRVRSLATSQTGDLFVMTADGCTAIWGAIRIRGSVSRTGPGWDGAR